MAMADLQDSPVGRLVPISGYDARRAEAFTHAAFVPDPLPVDIPLSAATWGIIAAASLELGRLDAAGRLLPEPLVIRRPQIIREAQATSALEGTYLAFTEIVEAGLGALEQADPQTREVLNYIVAAEHSVREVERREITVGLLCELQGLLVSGTRSADQDQGRIRTRQVVIGPSYSGVRDARFVPAPPGDLLESGFRDWADWVGSRSSGLPPVVRAAVGHYQFETLHPFADGNGRIGRLVIVLQLLKYGVIRDALLTVSPWFEARRREYQDALLRVSQTGNWDDWVGFFGAAVRDQARETVVKVEALVDFQARTKRLVESRDIRGTGRSLAEDLVGDPVVTISTVARQYGVSRQAAANAVQRLADAGLLREAAGKRLRRVFVCPEVIAIAEA
jgi:Fic family protein